MIKTLGVNCKELICQMLKKCMPLYFTSRSGDSGGREELGWAVSTKFDKFSAMFQTVY